ncbi:hypothetical protein ACFE04_025043 [Oxalis oulophora]
MEEKRSEYKGHVVVVPYPSQGHINPLLQFAKRLASKGIKSTLATTHYTINSIHAPNINVEPISDGFDESGFSQAKDEQHFITSFKINGSKTLADVIIKYKHTQFPINAIVYDSFFPWANDVAKDHAILGAPFFTNSAADCAFSCLIHHGIVKVPLKEEDCPLVLPGLPPYHFKDLPGVLTVATDYNWGYLAMKLGQFEGLDKLDWVFANSFQGLEDEVVEAISQYWTAKLIGPMIPSAYLDGQIEGDKGYGGSLWEPLSEECANFLNTKPPKSVIYISFGSMAAVKSQQFEEIANGLKETGVNFLWVVRKTEIEKLPKVFIDSTKDQGCIVTWCNQLEVLAHKAIGCFVSHCGWNSTLEGLSLGVPMIGMPQWADQYTNAKFVEEVWGTGVRAKENENGVVNKIEFMKCLKDVMEGKRSKEIGENVYKWSKLAKEAVSKGGSSDKHINEFVEHLLPKAR